MSSMRRSWIGLWALLSACGDEKPEPPPTQQASCVLGVTTDSAFDPVEPGGILWMRGGGQGSLSVWLAVRTSTPIDIEQTEILIALTSSDGEATSRYTEGGLDPSCTEESCELLFLNTTTRNLVADPLDLANLPVTVSLTVRTGLDEYCSISQEGSLRRFEG